MGTPPDDPSSSGHALEAMVDDPASPAPSRDVVVVQGATEHGALVVRLKAEGEGEPTVEVGELRPLREGQPIVGEVLKLTARSEDARVFDAEVLASATPGGATETSKASALGRALPHKGPARVTSEAFRANWDGIFGHVPTRGAPN